MGAEAVYRALLRCYPAAFRDEYGTEMSLVFAGQLGEARRTGAHLPIAILWLEAARDALTIAPKEHCHVILQDLRYALRAMAANSGFAAVAILSVALGIGANTAIFSIWNGLIRSSLPAVRNPEQLVMLSNPDDDGMWSGRWTSRTDGDRAWLTYGEFEVLRDRADAFSEMMASESYLDDWQVRIEGAEPEQVYGRLGPGYFSTLGIPIMLGREIVESDNASSLKVCVINEAFATQFFPGRDPIRLHITSKEDKRTCQVVGIAGNARTQGLRGEVDPRFYLPEAQYAGSTDSPIFLIRTAAGEAHVLAAARQAIQQIDPDLPIYDARTLQQQLAPRTAQDRMTAQLATVFGCAALALSAIGLFGVISYATARRRGEIAIRVALGARPARIIAMILRENALVIAIGMAIGTAFAYGASRLIASQLYGIAPQDPATMSFAAGLLVSVALVAAYLPARRASQLDPMTALRRE